MEEGGCRPSASKVKGVMFVGEDVDEQFSIGGRKKWILRRRVE
jgi:hypothetical protein